MAHQQPRPPTPGSSGTSWGGDGTLHAYCYDYMVKRGWTATASAFAADAGINESEWQGPPIEAPQGLLYEWWAVFWDVFVARSQKTGQRNIHADNYVEAVRVKREPVVINFAGPDPPAPITMPRSLSHSSRPPLGGHPGPRPTHTHPGQLHVLEQQQLQQQMQQGRAPIPGQRPPNGPPPPQQYHLQAPPPPPGPPPHLQGPPQHPQHLQQHSQGPPPPQQGGPPYPPGGIGQPLMHSYQPPSAQSSPHLQHAQHPYANGRPQGGPGGPPPPPQMRQQIGMQQQEMIPGSNGLGPMGPAYGQAMLAVGLVGRDPESLNGDEQNAVAAQMRRAGVLPPLPPSTQQGQQHIRAQQARVASQRMHPDPQQQMQRPPYPPQGMTPQQQMHERQQHQQQMAQQQQQQQREREHFAQQQRLQGPPGGPPPQLQYNPSQVGSPASPNYSSASPYATPLAQHMSIPPSQGPSQGSPQPFPPPLPPPSRAAAAKTRGAANKMSPAASAAPKRGGANLEDPSPRSRKRARGGTKEEEMISVGGGPETPNFDGGGPPSPGGMGIGMPGGQYSQGGPMPYRPSPSPSQQLQDQSTRGALDALQTNASQNARMLAHQAQQHHTNDQMARQANDQMYGQGGGGELVNGDMGGGGGGMVNGHSQSNGNVSRPGSSTGYLQPPNNSGGLVSSPNSGNPNMNGGSGNSGPSPRPNSPSLHITLPPPPTHLQISSTDMTPGGTARPFAGAAHAVTPVPALSELPSASTNGAPAEIRVDSSAGAGSYNFNTSGDDMYADLSLDFAFDDFVNDGLFKDGDLAEGLS